MTLAELEYAEKRMQQKWHDLVMEEQKGAPVQVLERMYSSYILMVEEYNRCSEEYRCEHQDQPIPVAVKQKRVAKSGSTEHTKRAS